MRPSSSRCELFGGVLARGPVAAAVSDEAWLAALLRVEAALARVTAPPDAAAAITEACRPERFDVAALGAAAAAGGNPVIPLVDARLAAALGLAVPVLPWHTDRTRIAELAGALGTTAGAIAKPARDVTLLAQTEVGEVGEGRPGGSSSMPHKRNPVAAVSVLAAAAQ